MKARRILATLGAAALLAAGTTAARAQQDDKFPAWLIPKANTYTRIAGSVQRSDAIDGLESAVEWRTKVVPTKLTTWRKTLPPSYRTATHVTLMFVLDCADYMWTVRSALLSSKTRALASWSGDTWNEPQESDVNDDYNLCSSTFGPDFNVRFNPIDPTPPVVVTTRPAATAPQTTRATLAPPLTNSPTTVPIRPGSTFANPIGLNEAATAGRWSVKVSWLQLDANDTVFKANQFNAKPPQGYQYVIVGLDVTWAGPGDRAPGNGLGLNLVTTDSRQLPREFTAGFGNNYETKLAPGFKIAFTTTYFMPTGAEKGLVLSISDDGGPRTYLRITNP